MGSIFFVTGTDTGIGKTWCTVALVRALRRAGRRVGVMKPVAAGATLTPAGLRNEDALALIEAAGSTLPYELVNPCCLPLAASPHIAAAAARVRIDPLQLGQAARRLAADVELLVVEGAGGWLAPIGDQGTMADVARAMAARVILVVGLRLGCLSHALLTRDAVRASGLSLAGWMANRIDPAFLQADANAAMLAQRIEAPLLGMLPYAPSAATGQPGPVAHDIAMAALAAATLRPPFA